ncbi:MAG: ribosome maturation factor RimP [Clostridia bacterium]|nr:ribosome maturation factor RimP [Clostridia bacterium]
MAKKIEQFVHELVKKDVEALGYELVDVEFDKKQNMDSELVIYIDKDGGVDLDDCEKVSTAIDPLIDAKCPITDPYVLVVSSPGIDRPFKTERDFVKHLGEKVDIKLYEKLNGKKDITAVLKEYTPEELTLEDSKGKEFRVEMKKIAFIRAYIDFSGLN